MAMCIPPWGLLKQFGEVVQYGLLGVQLVGLGIILGVTFNKGE